MSDTEHVRIEGSSQRVRVDLDGATIAESTRPQLLHEAGLPTRYYLPREDVRLDLLEPTDTGTHCPYKGDAEYWSVRSAERVHTDLVWSYPTPIPECQAIAGLMAFPQERVDLFVDGSPLPAR